MSSQAALRGEARAWLGLLLVIALALALRQPWLSMPLDRDEGEHAYVAAQMRSGLVPYRDAVDSKPPGVLAAYLLALALFGESARGLHLGLALAHVLSILAFFLLCRGAWGATVALIAAASFAALTSNPWLGAMAAKPEMFYLLPAIAGVHAFVRGARSGHAPTLLFAGLLHGLAGLVKQIGALQLAALLGWLVLSGWRSRQYRRTGRAALLVLAGAALPCAAAYLWFARLEAADDLVYWTLTYNFQFARSPVGLGRGIGMLGQRLGWFAYSDALSWAVALLGAFWLLRSGAGAGWVWAWALSAAASVLPGGFFLSYYFLVWAPPVAALVGLGLRQALEAGVGRGVSPGVGWLACATAALSPMLLHAGFVGRPLGERALQIYRQEPHMESVGIADYLRARTTPAETVLIVGSEPQILFGAQRRSATRYSLFYPVTSWTPDADALRDEFVAQARAASPRYVLSMNSVSSLTLSATPNRDVQDRLGPWLDESYRLEAALLIGRGRPYPLVAVESKAVLAGQPVLAYIYRRRD